MSEVDVTEEDFQELMATANTYNEALYQFSNASIGDAANILSDASYNSILNLTGNGMMGTIEIPSISVNLPIYHGTSDEVLTVGVGHAQGSSLPVGGINTRSILTGHRGLPNAKLFTRLDELENGDMIYIRICDQILAYQVYLIEVIEPEEVEKVETIENKDLISLVTCTPYGINSHRLVITAERVEYIPEEYDSITNKIPSVREILFTVTPILLGGVAVITLIKKRKE